MNVFAKLVLAALAAAVVWQAAPGQAQEGEEFTVWGLVGQASDGSNGKELGIIVTGEMAMKIYKALPGPEKPEACTDGFEKRDGAGMFCIRSADNKDYQCSFGYVLGEQRVTYGPLRC